MPAATTVAIGEASTGTGATDWRSLDIANFKVTASFRFYCFSSVCAITLLPVHLRGRCSNSYGISTSDRSGWAKLTTDSSK